MTVLRFRASIILIEFKKTTGTNANKKAVHLMDTLIKKDEVDLTDPIDNLNRNQEITRANTNEKVVSLTDYLMKKAKVSLTDLTNGLNTAYVTLSYFRKKGMSLTHSLTEKASVSLSDLRNLNNG